MIYGDLENAFSEWYSDFMDNTGRQPTLEETRDFELSWMDSQVISVLELLES